MLRRKRSTAHLLADKSWRSLRPKRDFLLNLINFIKSNPCRAVQYFLFFPFAAPDENVNSCDQSRRLSTAAVMSSCRQTANVFRSAGRRLVGAAVWFSLFEPCSWRHLTAEEFQRTTWHHVHKPIWDALKDAGKLDFHNKMWAGAAFISRTNLVLHYYFKPQCASL